MKDTLNREDSIPFSSSTTHAGELNARREALIVAFAELGRSVNSAGVFLWAPTQRPVVIGSPVFGVFHTASPYGQPIAQLDFARVRVAARGRFKLKQPPALFLVAINWADHVAAITAAASIRVVVMFQAKRHASNAKTRLRSGRTVRSYSTLMRALSAVDAVTTDRWVGREHSANDNFANTVAIPQRHGQCDSPVDRFRTG